MGNRFYIFKDGTLIASTATREQAIALIREEQKYETHYMLRSEFSIIYGTEEFIGYEEPKKSRKSRKTK